MAWIAQAALPLIILGVGCLLMALFGIILRIRGSAYEEMLSGSPYEVQYIFGTIIALFFGPLGLLTLAFVYLR